MCKLAVFIGTDSKRIAKKVRSFYSKFGDPLTFITPEDGNHPWNQVEEIERITAIVNGGSNVVLVTNSPYMVDHLSTLITGYEKLKQGKKIEDLLKFLLLKNPNSLIDIKKLKIYCIDKGKKKKNVLREDGSIDWKTFSEVSEYVLDQYFGMQEC